MHWLAASAALLSGYLIGSVPIGVYVCRLLGVEQSISASCGGTRDAWEAAGSNAALLTLIGSALKGVVSVLLVRNLYLFFFPEPTVMSVDEATLRIVNWRMAEALAASAVVFGHRWPIFNGFRGGAGGVVCAAAAMALLPLAGGMVWLTGALILWWTRIASVATLSIAASTFATFLILVVNQRAPWPYAIFGIIVLLTALWFLRDSREKLRMGTERVISYW